LFLQQAKVAGMGSRLGAVTYAKFTKDIVEVLFDRTNRQEEFLGNLPVRVACGDEAQKF
jgi:hypothetical protein